ncbi:hypothetical protein LMTR13_20865 [Bradyrhizobium icense]|uniref:Terminase small subunit protein n=2 Tax=Bradyrhizobium icense TaxID=1274631 RepID=A0A1B1UHN7_9BRAD|nr:hypothetical protein LMTR13_20865 [Bradyrhizobium icense]
MAEGESLTQICRGDEMPNRVTVYRWLEGNKDFREQYARAREAMMDFYADLIREIAFDESGDIVLEQKGDKTVAVANHAKVQRDKLKVDTLKWTMSKLFGRQYGDKANAAALDAPPSDMVIRWQRPEDVIDAPTRIERVIVDPKVSDLMASIDGRTRSAYPEGQTKAPETPVQQPPAQLTHNPTPPPADLSPRLWSAMGRVSDLIEQICPSDEAESVPEEIFGKIETFLRAHYLGSAAA